MSNILLLEDDLSLINGLSFAFKKQGFELVVARTLKEADSLWMDAEKSNCQKQQRHRAV